MNTEPSLRAQLAEAQDISKALGEQLAIALDRIADYERSIVWEQNCVNCGKVMESQYQDYCVREAAEYKLTEAQARIAELEDSIVTGYFESDQEWTQRLCDQLQDRETELAEVQGTLDAVRRFLMDWRTAERMAPWSMPSQTRLELARILGET